MKTRRESSFTVVFLSLGRKLFIGLGDGGVWGLGETQTSVFGQPGKGLALILPTQAIGFLCPKMRFRGNSAPFWLKRIKI